MQTQSFSDRLAGLDVEKLKRDVIVMWRSGRGNTLVKVLPKGAVASDDRMVGCCTTLGYVVGRTPEEMERILGFKSRTKLKNGAEIFRVDPLPSAEQFELRAYSYLPAGVPQVNGRVLNEAYPPGEGAPQWELANYPQSGLRWLTAVQPGQRFTCHYDGLPRQLTVFMGKGKR